MPPPGFTMIDNPAIEQGYAVGPSAFLVYAAIARHVNEQRRAWPGVERLVAITGLSNRSVRYGIDRLEKAGWLIVERQAGQRNVYRLPPVESMATDCQPPEISKAVDCQGVGQPVAAGEATSCQGVGQPVAAEVDLRSKPNKKTQGSRPKRGCAADIPGGLLELIDGWNNLADSIVRTGNGARRDPPAKAVLSGWKSASKNPEQRGALQDISALLVAIRGAKFCHGQGWFDLPWLFGKNKNNAYNIVRLMAGAHNEGNGNGNGRQRTSTGSGQRHPADKHAIDGVL